MRVRYQIQHTWPVWGLWVDGTRYIVRGLEVGLEPFKTYEEARKTVRAQLARDRKYGRRTVRYRIVEITYRVKEEYGNE